MHKEKLHQYFMAGFVAISILSFLYLNFGTSHASLSIQHGRPTASVATQKVDEEDETARAAAPKIMALAQLFDLAKKLVPRGK